jgi:hypothetical protein
VKDLIRPLHMRRHRRIIVLGLALVNEGFINGQACLLLRMVGVLLPHLVHGHLVVVLTLRKSQLLGVLRRCAPPRV